MASIRDKIRRRLADALDVIGGHLFDWAERLDPSELDEELEELRESVITDASEAAASDHQIQCLTIIMGREQNLFVSRQTIFGARTMGKA